MLSGDPCVTRSWLPGRPLTDFRRGRRNLPLPLERVKSGPKGDGQQGQKDPASRNILLIHAGCAWLDAVSGPASMAAPTGRRWDKAKHAGDRHDEGDEPKRHQGDREYGCEEIHAARSRTLVKLPVIESLPTRARRYASSACCTAAAWSLRWAVCRTLSV